MYRLFELPVTLLLFLVIMHLSDLYKQLKLKKLNSFIIAYIIVDAKKVKDCQKVLRILTFFLKCTTKCEKDKREFVNDLLRCV